MTTMKTEETMPRRANEAAPEPPADAREQAAHFRGVFDKLRNEVQKAFVGHDDVVENVLSVLLSDGHLLLEGVPGLGKTLLAHSLARALHLDFSRIQFTPDLMPSDILGTMVLDEKEGGGHELRFQEGPVVSNFVLADEINRATPKTQSAMLEAMQERQVSVARRTIRLPEPFIVIATQNPVEQDGTYPLPEAQLDRFMVKLTVGYPGEADYLGILNRTTGSRAEVIEPVSSGEEIMRMREIVRSVPVSAQVQRYAVRLVMATQPGSPYATSPSGSSALLARIDPAQQGAVFYPATVRNAAGYQTGSVAPGEWLTIFNPPFGPHEPALATLDENGRPPTELAGLRVLFDGVPAVLTYVHRCQINLIAPFGLSGTAETEIVLEQDGESSNRIVLPVSNTAPALFSANATGSGEVAAINEDLTINSPQHKALKGSIVALFGTGAGLLEPAIGDGDTPRESPPRIVGDVQVFVHDIRNGWIEAEVHYAGAAPGLIAGLVQINFRVPPDIFVPVPLILPQPVEVKWVVDGRESRALGIWLEP